MVEVCSDTKWHIFWWLPFKEGLSEERWWWRCLSALLISPAKTERGHRTQRENKETLSGEKRQSAAAVKEQCACLLYLWRHLSARVRKTERSLKFVVCGDESAVNWCVLLPTHAPVVSSCMVAQAQAQAQGATSKWDFKDKLIQNYKHWNCKNCKYCPS